MAYEVLCSRVYTDSTLCLEEDPMTCLCAAVQFAILVTHPAFYYPFCCANQSHMLEKLHFVDFLCRSTLTYERENDNIFLQQPRL